MASNRSHFRNVHFYDATKPNDTLGGLIQNGSVTESNFLRMLGIILVTAAPIRVQYRASGDIVSMSDNPLQLGIYDVYCDGTIRVSGEPWVQRIMSFNVSGREDAFRGGIRARDGKCVISGVVNQRAPHRWSSFEAAHIFPSEKENLWIEWNYGRWVTDIDDDTVGASKINSLQNGFLLREHIHSLFDQYLVSVNPDDSYKIVVFDVDLDGMDGRTLDQVCRDEADPHRVSDELLRWHFRQSVLANMRGAGEPVFENDFAGKDMMKEIREGPCAKERFELELAARFKAAV